MRMIVKSLTVSIANVCVGKYLELWTIWSRMGSPIDPSVSQRVWRTRQIGFLFSKRNNFWVVFVLIAPLSVNQKEEQFKFCYRDSFLSGSKSPYSFVQSDLPLRDMIAKIKVRLREPELGHRYLKRVLWDVLWGWERYLAQVKADVTGVNCPLQTFFQLILISRLWPNQGRAGGRS